MKHLKKGHVAAAAVGLVALLSGSEAWAQASPTQTTQTATMLNAAQLAAQAGTAATNAQVTATVNAVAGQSFYITALEAQACGDATGGAVTNQLFTLTGVPGGNLTYQMTAAAGATCENLNVPFATPFKALSGTAVTWYSPAALSHESYMTRIYGFYGQ